ncbi:hypothetical protein GCM10023144_12640 [Pigmentiphaga soli]|uniref:Cytochrome c domain-containing protein n=1 Tax=Pigmentiphaga soli TaxID=1007095 RepID=A0ABP8GPA8_9BURK
MTRRSHRMPKSRALRAGRIALAMLAALAAASCERAAQNMYDQPRTRPYRQNPLFPDGSSARVPPAGAEPYASGPAADPSGGRLGRQEAERQAAADRAQAIPGPVTLAMLRHGRELYAGYCLPCHSPAGDGDGRVVRRGFPAPPSFGEARLLAAPDRHIYDVISDGFGVMARYGNRIEPADRWAIVAFVRALQLSQHAELAALPPQARARAQAALAADGAGDVHTGGADDAGAGGSGDARNREPTR